MKIKLFCDSGANAHSCREEIVDTEEYFGLSTDEWLALSDEEQYEHVQEWTSGYLDIGWTEIEE